MNQECSVSLKPISTLTLDRKLGLDITIKNGQEYLSGIGDVDSRGKVRAKL